MPARPAVLTALLLDRPLCLSCLYDRSGMTSFDVDEALDTIEGVLLLRREIARCRACGGTQREAVWIDRPRV